MGILCCYAFDKHWDIFVDALYKSTFYLLTYYWIFFFIHVTFTAIVPGDYPGRSKCALGWLQKLTHVPLAIAILLVYQYVQINDAYVTNSDSYELWSEKNDSDVHTSPWFFCVGVTCINGVTRVFPLSGASMQSTQWPVSPPAQVIGRNCFRHWTACFVDGFAVSSCLLRRGPWRFKTTHTHATLNCYFMITVTSLRPYRNSKIFVGVIILCSWNQFSW